MDWTQVDIFTASEGVEPVLAMLMEEGISGAAISDPADFEAFLRERGSRWELIDDELLSLRGRETFVTAYLSQTEQGMLQLERLRSGLERLRALDKSGKWGRLALECGTVKEESWENSWKRFFKPIKIGEKLVVCPTWEDYTPQSGDVVIRLDPGMAFGTGTHDSTRLCVKFLERYLREGASVLDIGCGSGILAISALLLGAGDAVGVDIDETAVRVSRENAAVNHVENRVSFSLGNLATGITRKFDLVTANIVADVIIALAPDAPALLKPGGILLTSGVIDTQEPEVRAALLDAGLRFLDRAESGGWVSLAFEAPPRENP